MAVTVRGWIQGARAGQSYTVGPWPAGTVPGDLCLVHCGGDYAISGPQTSGWAPTGHEAHWKILTATDLASQLVIDGSHFKLVVFAGAKGVGRTASTNGVQAVVGSYVWVESSRTQQPIALGPGIQGVEWQDRNLVWQAQYAIAAPTSGTGSTFVKLFDRKRDVTDQAVSLALHPLDNLSTIEEPDRVVRLIAAALNRKLRPWWRHPRWHVHHWKINFDLSRNLRRMFQPCATCRKPLGFGYSPLHDHDGDHHMACAGVYMAETP